MAELSASQARSVALAAQRFGRRPASGPGAGAGVGQAAAGELGRLTVALGAVQIVAANVLTRSLYLPFYSRLGRYQTGAPDGLAYRQRRLFECWGHAASLLPVGLYPALRWRVEEYARSRGAVADVPAAAARARRARAVLVACRRAALAWVGLLAVWPAAPVPAAGPRYRQLLPAHAGTSLFAIDAASARMLAVGLRDSDDPVFVSTLTVGADAFARRHPDISADSEPARILRSIRWSRSRRATSLTFTPGSRNSLPHAVRHAAGC